MSLHHLDPDREPRECPSCDGLAGEHEHPRDLCEDCGGFGRLGVEGAEPDVEIHWRPYLGGYSWRLAGESEWRLPLLPTKSAVLAAARSAHSQKIAGEPSR